MSIKNLFTGGKTISRKFLRKNYRQDPTFQKIISDPEIKKVLQRPEAQRELHHMMSEKTTDGSLSGNDMRIVFDELVHKGKGYHISSEAGRRVASRVFTDGSRRYLSSRADFNENASNPVIRSGYKSERTKIVSPTGHATKLPPAFFASRVNSLRASTDSSKTEKKPSFFDSMKSASQNKKS